MNAERLVEIILDQNSKNGSKPEDIPGAYFCAEFGINPAIPIYSGGLGMLAGEHIKAAADLGLPLVAVGAIYKKGYFQQQIGKDGRQVEEYPEWNIEDFAEKIKDPDNPKEDATVEIDIYGLKVKIQAWKYTHESKQGKSIDLILLDTDIEENTEKYQKAYSHNLYGSDEDYKLAQAAILGMGGVKMLRKLGYSNLEKYHMNEGHAALLAIQLLKDHDGNVKKVKEKCMMTTHTPVSAGHARYTRELVNTMLGVEIADLAFTHGTDDQDPWKLNMTKLALNLSSYKNGVSKKHGAVSRKMFKRDDIDSITNGVHSLTWMADPMRALLDREIPGWSKDPMNLLKYAVGLPDYDIIEAHMQSKIRLIEHIKTRFPQANIRAKDDKGRPILTIGFARRFASYKRAELLFSDVERLEKIASEGPVQIIFAGKAHPNDGMGKDSLQEVIRHIIELHGKTGITFLSNYNMNLAKQLVSGVDVWLNTPRPPHEASGTSGMKAAHNGVVNFSVLDGWCCECLVDGKTGFTIGEPYEGGFNEHVDHRELDKAHADDLFTQLENTIIPMFYDRKREWAQLMKNSLALTAFLNMQRAFLTYQKRGYKFKGDWQTEHPFLR
jgi:starch phosphorylase